MITLLLLTALVQDGEKPAGHSLHGEAFNEGPRQRAYLMDGMGKITFDITAKDPQAQKFFLQGVGQLHGFYYFEAERSFRQAAAIDPDCAMAYWGMAMANVNNEKRAKPFIEKADKLKDKVSKRERMWIDALSAYHKETKNDVRGKAFLKSFDAILNEYPDELEARAFLAWALYHHKSKGVPITSTESVDAIILQVLEKNPMHPGAHHYKIHLWDEEKPARALKSAELFGPSATGIAHAWHMPGHIYSKLQRYADAAWQQEASSRVDHAQMIRDRTMPYQIHNYVHNQQWCVTDLKYIGRVRHAAALAENLAEIPRHPKLNKVEEADHATRIGRTRLLETLTTWELWDEVLARAGSTLLPIDNRDDSARRLRAIGAAHVEKGDLDAARMCLASLEELAPKDEKDEKKTKAAKSASAELEGRIALAEGKFKEALEKLEKADGYPKESLALAYLKAGEKDKAEKKAKEAVDGAKNQLHPLAVQVEVLRKLEKADLADAAWKPLVELARFADPGLPALERIGYKAPAEVTACEAATKGTDLDGLGPLTWKPSPARLFTLPDSEGRSFSLDQAVDRPVVLIFYLGSRCEHCRQQLDKFASVESKFREAGLTVVAVSPETPEELRKAVESGRVKAPFTFLSDPDKRQFRAWRCYDDFEDFPLHGTFLVASSDRKQALVRWQEISYTPFMEVEFLLAEARRLLNLP
jgi:peroxiredoxin